MVEDSAAASRCLERSERSLGKLLGGQLNRSGMTWRSPALRLNCAVIQMQQAGRLTTVPSGPTSSESVSSNLKHSIDMTFFCANSEQELDGRHFEILIDAFRAHEVQQCTTSAGKSMVKFGALMS